MYLFFGCQVYKDCCTAGFDIQFWFVEGLGVVGVDSEQYDTYLSQAEIAEQEPSNDFNFYHYEGKFRMASLEEIIDKNYLSFVDGSTRVDDRWVSGLKFDDYVQETCYFEDEEEKNKFVAKLMEDPKFRQGKL